MKKDKPVYEANVKVISTFFNDDKSLSVFLRDDRFEDKPKQSTGINIVLDSHQPFVQCGFKLDRYFKITISPLEDHPIENDLNEVNV